MNAPTTGRVSRRRIKHRFELNGYDAMTVTAWITIGGRVVSAKGPTRAAADRALDAKIAERRGERVR